MNVSLGSPTVTVTVGERGRLGELLRNSVLGDFPPADGVIEAVPSPEGPADAVVAFTGHHVVAADVGPQWVATALRDDELGAPMKAEFLTRVARRLGVEAGMLDVVLGAVAVPSGREIDLEPAEDTFEHARLTRARRYRRGVRCLRDARGGFLTIGYGLENRVEVSIEVDATARGAGVGTSLARRALGLVEPGEAVFAQVAPGNVASLRCLLAAGYRPIGAEVLFCP